MAKMSDITLDVPDSLMADIKSQASRAGVSVNQFIIDTLVGRVASQHEAEAYFKARGSLSNGKEHALEILKRSGEGNPPMPSDEPPEGWTDADTKALFDRKL